MGEEKGRRRKRLTEEKRALIYPTYIIGDGWGCNVEVEVEVEGGG